MMIYAPWRIKRTLLGIFSPQVKLLEHEAYNSPASNADINAWNYTPFPVHFFMTSQSKREHLMWKSCLPVDLDLSVISVPDPLDRLPKNSVWETSAKICQRIPILSLIDA
jgi:hypothetical protein